MNDFDKRLLSIKKSISRNLNAEASTTSTNTDTNNSTPNDNTKVPDVGIIGGLLKSLGITDFAINTKNDLKKFFLLVIKMSKTSWKAITFKSTLNEAAKTMDKDLSGVKKDSPWYKKAYTFMKKILTYIKGVYKSIMDTFTKHLPGGGIKLAMVGFMVLTFMLMIQPLHVT